MEKERLVWIDVLNIVACAGVLLLHCTNGQVHGFSGTPSADWYIGLTTHSFVLWPVDVFFMISGFTLIRKSLLTNDNNLGGVKRFYGRRLKRLAVPLLSWNVLYMLLHFASAYSKGETFEPISEVVRKFALFDYNGFMWFFVPLLLIYLSMPFFAIFVLNADRRLLRLFLVIGLAMSFIPPLDADFRTRENLENFYLMGSRFLYFIVAGYYIGHFEISLKTRRRIYTCAVASAAVMFVGTMSLTLYYPEHYRYFLSYTNFPCTITAMGVFTYFKYHDWQKTLTRLRIRKAFMAQYSGFSLGIYLIQGAWFAIIGHFNVCDNHILLKFVLMYVLCICSVWMMKRIPAVRKMVS